MRNGVIGTAIWLFGLAWIIWLKRSDAFDLKLNEWGDFLAGAFAPLAFFWLIFGYLQQGRELKLSTLALQQQEKALMLQVRELKDSVKQQQALVQATKEDIAMNKEALNRQFLREKAADQPVPEVKYAGRGYNGGKDVYEFNVYNSGKAASRVSVVASGVNFELKGYLDSPGYRWGAKNFLIIRIYVPFGTVINISDKVAARVDYVDCIGSKESLPLYFEWNKSNTFEYVELDELI